ncbi:MAG: hypothetical protein ACI8W8_000433 [Rhodothermales bacterium]|jgi:hypothetical protein
MMSEEHIDVVEARGNVLVVDDFAHDRTMIRKALVNDGHVASGSPVRFALPLSPAMLKPSK